MPQQYHVKITAEASSDLVTLFEFIEKDSPQNAVTVTRRLFDAVDSLDLFPQRYKVHPFSQNPHRVIRSMPVPPFIVYYRIREEDHVVEVITVQHSARLHPQRFN